MARNNYKGVDISILVHKINNKKSVVHTKHLYS